MKQTGSKLKSEAVSSVADLAARQSRPPAICCPNCYGVMIRSMESGAAYCPRCRWWYRSLSTS